MPHIPPGTFKGQHPMTPEVLRYGTLKGVNDRPVYYELSTGRDPRGAAIFGVTVRAAGGRHLVPDPSTMFFSLADAEAFIKTL